MKVQSNKTQDANISSKQIGSFFMEHMYFWIALRQCHKELWEDSRVQARILEKVTGRKQAEDTMGSLSTSKSLFGMPLKLGTENI